MKPRYRLYWRGNEYVISHVIEGFSNVGHKVIDYGGNVVAIKAGHDQFAF